MPRAAGASVVSDEIVLNIDLAPTILDIAGVKNDDSPMQGSSLRPLIMGETVPWRQACLYEYVQEDEFWRGPGVAPTPTILALRTHTHKLVTYPDYDNWTQLFDLEADPYEMRNLVGYERAVTRHVAMCTLLDQQLRKTGYVDRSIPDRWLVGLTNSYFSYRAHASIPTASRRPPLLHPNC